MFLAKSCVQIFEKVKRKLESRVVEKEDSVVPGIPRGERSRSFCVLYKNVPRFVEGGPRRRTIEQCEETQQCRRPVVIFRVTAGQRYSSWGRQVPRCVILSIVITILLVLIHVQWSINPAEWLNGTRGAQLFWMNHTTMDQLRQHFFWITCCHSWPKLLRWKPILGFESQ